MNNCLIEKLNSTIVGDNFPVLDPNAGKITSYIINQTHLSESPVTYRDPSQTIIKDVASKNATEKVYIDGVPVYKDIIARIRENSDFYLGQVVPGSTDGKLHVAKITKENKSLMFDGITSVENYINWGDVFMKLPRFWWRVVTLETDVFRVDFTMDEEVVEGEDTWQEWDGNTFIGVYLSSMNPYGYSEDYDWLSSRTDATTAPNKTFVKYKEASRNKASQTDSENLTGYSLLTYESQRILALLGWGWLGGINLENITNQFTPESITSNRSGYADAFGFTDGYAINPNNNNKYYNFWGLESFGKQVWLDNLTKDGSGEPKYTLLDYEGNRSRVVYADFVNTSNPITITKLLLNNGDILPSEFTQDHSTLLNVGYYDNSYARTNGVNAIAISENFCGIDIRYSDSSITGINTRIQYHGDWEEGDPYEESASMPPINPGLMDDTEG